MDKNDRRNLEAKQEARPGAPLIWDSGPPLGEGLRAPNPKPKSVENLKIVSNHGKKFNQGKKQKPIKNLGRTKDVKVDNARS